MRDATYEALVQRKLVGKLPVMGADKWDQVKIDIARVVRDEVLKCANHGQRVAFRARRDAIEEANGRTD